MELYLIYGKFAEEKKNKFIFIFQKQKENFPKIMKKKKIFILLACFKKYFKNSQITLFIQKILLIYFYFKVSIFFFF